MAGFKRPEVSKEKIPSAVLAKWGYPVLAEGFVPFPKKFLRCLPAVVGRDGIEKLQVILSLADYLRDDLKVFPSKEYLAFVAGLPLDRFKIVLDELRDDGLVDYSGTDECFMVSLGGVKEKVLCESK